MESKENSENKFVQYFSDLFTNLTSNEFNSTKQSYFLTSIGIMMLSGFLYAGIADLSGQFTWLAIAFTLVIHIIAYAYSYLLKLINGYLLDSEKDLKNRHTGVYGLLLENATEKRSNDHKYVHYSGIYGILMLNFFLMQLVI